MKKLTILFAFALPIFAAGPVDARERGTEQAAVSRAIDRSVNISAQTRQKRRTTRQRAPAARAPARQAPTWQAPAGMRMGIDPDPRIELDMQRMRGHAG